MLIGPFSQVVTMEGLPAKGPIAEGLLRIHTQAGIAVDRGCISAVGPFEELAKKHGTWIQVPESSVCLPGWIDAHTHICFAGNRVHDYTKRLSGKTYQQIVAEGGGIMDTVVKTRSASKEELVEGIVKRGKELIARGVTTCEIKSGYGLNVEDELKMLAAIEEASLRLPLHVVPTCLAAHTKPPEFSSPSDYLNHLLRELLPRLKTKRLDVFVEEGAFSVDLAKRYLLQAKDLGFTPIIHADQFSRGGALLAAEIGAHSAEHLEVSNEDDADAMAKEGVIPVVLPGASLGLGIPFAPARMLLDRGLPLVIASDWNPGSAPMGDLLCQAALIGAQQKLSMAETLAAITVRAAEALQLKDRGILQVGMQADMVVFPCADYREILYAQGAMKPCMTVINGNVAF